MPVLRERRQGSRRQNAPRPKPVTAEAWAEKSRELPPNVVDWAGATPDMMLVALRPYRNYPEVREHMNLLDGQRIRRQS